jgi:hypothetical protein
MQLTLHSPLGFTKQLLLASSQAFDWLEALEPLYEILSSVGMLTKEAWECVLIFTKAVRTVQGWDDFGIILNHKAVGGISTTQCFINTLMPPTCWH